MENRRHSYSARVVWDGNTGEGTSSYASYGRSFHASVDGKPDLRGSSDPMFRGDAHTHNPEDLFVTAVSSCHMLVYLALSARAGVRVHAYEDDAVGTLTLDREGGGRFEEITLSPRVTIDDAEKVELAARLHERAHELCFIANSCSAPIRVRPVIDVEARQSAASGRCGCERPGDRA
jgi:organic hydroperoxide reductase OsmC/OhrA